MNKDHNIICKLLSGAVFACVLVAPAGAQTTFDTPEVAANSLVVALARGDQQALVDILGDDGMDLLPAGEESEDLVERFLNGWIKFHGFEATASDTRLLAVGEHGWTLPIPIVRSKEGWHFDTVAAQHLIKVRKIGENELSVIQSLLAYHDAQVEYAQQDWDKDGRLEYAQRFVSTPGTHDGLYWATAPGEPQSPLGPLLAAHEPGTAYHGYFYRILTGQGEYANGGAVSYVDNGNMTGGFGIVAWPAEYGSTGVMSFMMGRDGRVYEADLGPQGADYASTLSNVDPDGRWAPSLDVFDDLVDLR